MDYGRPYDGSGALALANDWVRHFALSYGMINGVPGISLMLHARGRLTNV